MIGEFNLDHWPIVYFKLNGLNINEDSYEEYKKYYLNLLVRCKRNNEKMTLICDLNHLNNVANMPLKYVIKQSQFNKEVYEHNKNYLKCVCILCKNKSFKNIINLYFSFAKPAAPFKLCRCIDKANIYISTICNIKFDIKIFDKNLSEDAQDDALNDALNDNLSENAKLDVGKTNMMDVSTKNNENFITC